jgi:hypothetical protein
MRIVLVGMNDDAASRSRCKASSLRCQSSYTAEDKRDIQRYIWGRRAIEPQETKHLPETAVLLYKRLSIKRDTPSEQVHSKKLKYNDTAPMLVIHAI